MDKYRFSEREQALMESMPVPFAVFQLVDKKIVTLAVSDGFCELLGVRDRAEAYALMDRNTYQGVHPDDAARLGNAAFTFMKDGGPFDCVYRFRKQQGDGWLVIHAYGRHIFTETGVRLAQIWYADEGDYQTLENRSVSGIGRSLSATLQEENLLRASYYDDLTGLPTMTYFFELAEAGKNAVRAAGGKPVLLYMDLSGMKYYNYKHGFAAGDDLLRAFAKLLVATFALDSCCRIGADHFAARTEEAGLDDTLQALLADCRELNGGKTLPVHIGVYRYEIEDVPASTACDRAKLACRSMAGSYASGVSAYSVRLSEEAVMRQYIVENFDTAMREKWIRVYLQPIIRSVNEKVCDVEALARWFDPEKGILSPASFIPALEEAGLIYKLDLYMVEQVLEAIRRQTADGIFVVPHSINFSRSDFDHCDVVEEVRRRVDAAGVDRSRITIELTESVIGSDYAFMKEQVERFRALGFPVWMDDFGSGYSSMDVLQTIPFDLIKFDMSFMKRLDEGGKGKIMLTELMRMATSLGVDTVCEGVETEAQVRFLQEIGCAKLQGFYYSRPVPADTLREMHHSNTLIVHEDPMETDYYESIGRVNLFDLGVVASEEQDALQHTFSTIPIAVMEIRDNKAHYIRSNGSYQEFIRRFFGNDVFEEKIDLDEPGSIYGPTVVSVLKQCGRSGSYTFFDGKTPEGLVIHSFARRIGVNPVTGGAAVAIAALSITEPDESTTYADIARALAADYYNIYVIDLDTNDYIEYVPQAGGEELSIERHGKEFFESARRDTMTRIYKDDQDAFLELFTKENVLRELDAQGVFTTTYRLTDTGTPMYVNMKITRMRGGNRIILGVSILDMHVKQRIRRGE